MGENVRHTYTPEKDGKAERFAVDGKPYFIKPPVDMKAGVEYAYGLRDGVPFCEPVEIGFGAYPYDKVADPVQAPTRTLHGPLPARALRFK